MYETGLRASLERLQLEYVDVVFANRPDPNTPIEGECTLPSAAFYGGDITVNLA